MLSMKQTNGKPCGIKWCATTAIPRSEWSQINQTRSSPETIAAAMNKMENALSGTPKHFNSRRAYPFWKTCVTCCVVFPCHTKEQATRNKTCGKVCAARRSSEWKAGRLTPLSQRKGTHVRCAVCRVEVWKQDCWLKRVQNPTCSKKCNGVLRGEEWAKHAHKGRAAWGPEAVESCRRKLSGENNPAWKGGVTYMNKHGNYKPIKYVRCPRKFLAMSRKDGYVMEHRLIVAAALDRPLIRSETVHHEDHNPQNNRIENLSLFLSNRDHKLYEAHGTPLPVWRGSDPSTARV